MDRNKVQFNLKNVHYAKQTVKANVIAWEAPVHVPGAVALALDPQGNVEPFYADGVVYYQAVANNGYSGDLEMARFPDIMLIDIWGFELDDETKVILENALVEPSNFALLYQIDGDKNNDFYCLYNCSGTRPGIGGNTNTENKTPQTRKSTISAVSLPNGHVMARTTSETPKEVRENWFKKVFEKTVAETGTTTGTESGSSTETTTGTESGSSTETT